MMRVSEHGGEIWLSREREMNQKEEKQKNRPRVPVSLLAFLAKNALGLPSLGHAPSALPGRVGGSGRWRMTYDMSLHTFERPSCSHNSTRTHRRKPGHGSSASLVIILTVESAPACPPPAGHLPAHLPPNRQIQGGAGSWEEVLGRGGEGSRRLMWTRRVEWARASARPTPASPRAGGRKFLFLPADKI